MELTRSQIRSLKQKQKDIDYQANNLNGNRAWARRIRQQQAIEIKRQYKEMEEAINDTREMGNI